MLVLHLKHCSNSLLSNKTKAGCDGIMVCDKIIFIRILHDVAKIFSFSLQIILPEHKVS